MALQNEHKYNLNTKILEITMFILYIWQHTATLWQSNLTQVRKHSYSIRGTCTRTKTHSSPIRWWEVCWLRHFYCYQTKCSNSAEAIKKTQNNQMLLTSAPSRDFFNTATTSSWKATSSTHFGLLEFIEEREKETVLSTLQASISAQATDYI